MLSVNHFWRGVSEFVGGTLNFVQRGQHFSAHVENLLPGERLWGIIRSKQPILDSELQVISDPTLVFDRKHLKKALPVLILITFLWGLGNFSFR